jgi:hypothetical protein
MKWFSHKNNHALKPKVFNQLMFPAMNINNWLRQVYLFIRYQQSMKKERNHKYLQLVDFWHPNNRPNDRGRMHNQVDKLNTTPIWHANEITSTTQKWQSTTPSYYIPKAIVPSRSTLVVGYYTFEPIPVLNPIATNSKLECNQLLN